MTVETESYTTSALTTHNEAKMKETDGEKFRRLAEKRVNNAIKTIRLIGNLSNKSNYEYTDEEVEVIFSILTREVKSCRSRFHASYESSNGKVFSFNKKRAEA